MTPFYTSIPSLWTCFNQLPLHGTVDPLAEAHAPWGSYNIISRQVAMEKHVPVWLVELDFSTTVVVVVVAVVVVVVVVVVGKCMEVYGSVWKCMEVYGSVWSWFGFAGVLHFDVCVCVFFWKVIACGLLLWKKSRNLVVDHLPFLPESWFTEKWLDLQ